jgi:hypothetical protein
MFGGIGDKFSYPLRQLQIEMDNSYHYQITLACDQATQAGTPVPPKSNNQTKNKRGQTLKA